MKKGSEHSPGRDQKSELQRFTEFVKKVVAVPKSAIDKEEAKFKRRKRGKKQ
jgi:hypothetical protein